MTLRTLPGLGLSSDWDLGENGWKAGMDKNLLDLSVLVQAAIDGYVADLPALPTEGVRYIVTSGVNAGRIALRDQGVWKFWDPKEGFRVFNVASDSFHVYRDGAWGVDTSLRLRGVWSNAATYAEGDFVQSGGGVWYAKRENISVTPVEGDDWTLLLPGVTAADGTITFAKLAVALVQKSTDVAPDAASDTQIPTAGRVTNMIRANAILAAIRAADARGGGVSGDGKIFVDLLFNNKNLDLVNSSNYELFPGGVRPAVTYSANVVAGGTVSGSNSGWANNTIVTFIASGQLANMDKGNLFRFVWRAGTGGALTIHGAFMGVLDPTGIGFDPQYPVKRIGFAGAAGHGPAPTATAAAGLTITSSPVEYKNFPAGRAMAISYFVRTDGFMAVATKTGWESRYKVANEPGQVSKSGYTTAGTNTLGLERVDVLSEVYANAVVRGKLLTTGASPAKASILVAMDVADADEANIQFGFGRNGSFQTVALTKLFTADGTKYFLASDVAVTAGAGSSLAWRIVSNSGVGFLVRAVALQTDALFADQSNIFLPKRRRRTFHRAATGLGYDAGVGDVRYGRLYLFTQDWEVDGPTDFDIRLRVGMEHVGPMIGGSNNYPIAFTIALTVRYAETVAAMGAKQMVETDDAGLFGNRTENWIGVDSGHIAGHDEHYKTANVILAYEARKPGVYRFEVWGHSATDATGTLTSGLIAVNNPEQYGVAYEAQNGLYNSLEITASPLRRVAEDLSVPG